MKLEPPAITSARGRLDVAESAQQQVGRFLGHEPAEEQRVVTALEAEPLADQVGARRTAGATPFGM